MRIYSCFAIAWHGYAWVIIFILAEIFFSDHVSVDNTWPVLLFLAPYFIRKEGAAAALLPDKVQEVGISY